MKTYTLTARLDSQQMRAIHAIAQATNVRPEIALSRLAMLAANMAYDSPADLRLALADYGEKPTVRDGRLACGVCV